MRCTFIALLSLICRRIDFSFLARTTEVSLQGFCNELLLYVFSIIDVWARTGHLIVHATELVEIEQQLKGSLDMKTQVATSPLLPFLWTKLDSEQSCVWQK